MNARTIPQQLVELRNYKLRPGTTEDFVAYFEAHFLASQETVGMDVVGQFRVLDDPDRFVWIRRFPVAHLRGAALDHFYSGPVWEEFGPAANDMMLEFHDVHLLAPDPSAPAFAAEHVPHAARRAAGDEPRSTVIASFYGLDRTAGEARLPRRLVDAMGRALAAAPGVTELGRLITAEVANDYPHLSVHEGGSVAVWLLSDEQGGEVATDACLDLADVAELPYSKVLLAPTRRSTLR